MPRRVLFSFPSALFPLVFVVCLSLPGWTAGEDHPTGLRDSTPEEVAWLEQNAIRMTAPVKSRDELPPVVKNIEFLPAVNRQTLPNCGAYAPTYYMKTYHEARRHGWGQVNPWTHPERAMSPGIAYLFGQSDVYGGSMIGSIRVMCSIGIVPLSMLPDTYSYDRTVFPSATLSVEAMRHRAGEPVIFDKSTDEGFLAIKEWLASGEVAIFSITATDATFAYGREENVPGVDNDVIFEAGGSSGVGHAFTLIGYDDTKSYNDGTGVQQGAFLAVNSWGTTWGVLDPDVGTRGFAWFSYEYIRGAAGQILSMTAREDYEPRWVGLFAYEHPHSPQVVHDFRGGNLESPDWSQSFPPANPSEDASYDPLRPIAVDLTAEDGLDWEALWWRVFNVGAIPGLPHPGRTGTSHAWRVMKYEDAMAALGGPLFEAGDITRWRIVPMDRIQGPALEADGLPVESVLLPGYVDISMGLMDRGEDMLDPPMANGSALFADLNGNGWPDLLVVGSETQLYENVNGTFHAVMMHGLGDYGWAAAAAGDYNRDGLTDLAICGAVDRVATTRVYRNLGGFRFEDSGAELAGVAGSMMELGASITWGDYDNDGLEDLAFWGFAAGNSKHILVYRNRGDGTFEPASFTLPERHGAQLGWHDVNADGLLDLCAGSAVFFNQGDGTLNTTPVGLPPGGLWGDTPDQGIWADFTGNGLPDMARVYQQRINLPGGSFTTSGQIQIHRNSGDGTLEHTGTTIDGVWYPRLEAVDYNNDGLMDLAASFYHGSSSGIGGTTPRATALFRQVPDGSLRDAGHDLLATAEGAVLMADVDGDGDLDLLTTGYIRVEEGPWQRGARLHQSRFSEYPWGSRANTRPLPPVNLDVEIRPDTNEFVFLWDHGSDAETPRAALAYNVRIGTWPGAGNVLSPASSAPVTSTVRQYRVAADQPGLILRGLRPGHYHWSVRTVDGGRMASEWAPEQTFSMLDQFVVEDINSDGFFDAADLVEFAMMVRDHRDSLPPLYDFNEDEMISQADLHTLAYRLIGSSELFPGHYTIGPEGGIVEQGGIQLVVPPGVFPADPPVVLMIETATTGSAFEEGSAPLVYQVSGLPLTTGGSYDVILESPFPAGQSTDILVGERVYARGSRGIDWRYRVVSADALSDGRLRLEIPETSPDTRRSSQDDYSYSLNLGVLGGYAKYSGNRFSIAFPQRYVGDTVENVASALEAAYAKLRDEYGFSYARRTRWPVEVCLRDLGPDETGAMLSSAWGDNYGSIEINTRYVEDFQAARAVASHEFFHVVQGLYDPRGRVAKAYRMSSHYWVDEAMSTWAEALVLADPTGYRPVTYRDNMVAPYMGVTKGITGSVADVMEFGYGMAPLPKFLVSRFGQQAPLAVYTAIYGGADSVDALKAATPDTMIFLWYENFFSDLMEGKLYEASLGELQVVVGSNRQLTLEPGATVSWRLFPVKLTDLAAAPHMAGFRSDYPDLPADAVWAVRYEGDATLSLQLFRASITQAPEKIATVYGADEVKFTTVPNARSFQSRQERLFTLVTNTNDDSPYTREREGVLAIGLAQSGPFTLQEGTYSASAFGRSFPTFTIGGSIEGAPLSDVDEEAGALFPWVQASAWGGETVELTLSVQATIDVLTDSWTESGQGRTLSTTGIQSYILNKSDGSGNVLESSSNENGTFTVMLDAADRERGFATFDLRAVYPLAYQREGESPQNLLQEWPLTLFLFTMP